MRWHKGTWAKHKDMRCLASQGTTLEETCIGVTHVDWKRYARQHLKPHITIAIVAARLSFCFCPCRGLDRVWQCPKGFTIHHEERVLTGGLRNGQFTLYQCTDLYGNWVPRILLPRWKCHLPTESNSHWSNTPRQHGVNLGSKTYALP